MQNTGVGAETLIFGDGFAGAQSNCENLGRCKIKTVRGKRIYSKKLRC